jgi:hypothetical protein
MDLMVPVAEGLITIDADARLKEQALHFLRQWLTEPDFAAYRPQLEWLIRTRQWPGLLDRFYQILPFGTGGRRGAVGIGPNRMNLWTLGASVQGHCEYLKERFPGTEPLHVVLAYDVRRFEDQRRHYNPELTNPVLHLSSRDLAQHAACIYTANGIHASILPPDSARYLATPELSFTIRQLGAHGGLNVSASHNPPDDNGGKFYDERGGQPVPPDDQIMADLVEQVAVIKSVPWADAVRSGRVHFLDETPHRAYIDLCRRQSLIPPPRSGEIKVVFTPLHGVGAMTAMETLVAQGFRVVPVEAQMKPDGQFPNVTQTPNPEVPASMDRAVAVAREHAADLVLATDPDADRLGGMIPVPLTPQPPLPPRGEGGADQLPPLRSVGEGGWGVRGWSLKALHRLIVTSATYRQASKSRPELAVIDPRNRLLARQARLRLEAEFVRDVALASSGLLTRVVGGPSVFPPQPEGIYRFTQIDKHWKASVGPDRYRRGLYTYFWRSAPHPGLTVFDAPDASSTCTRRNRSNTPLQALTLLNDQGFFELAQGLAGRILREAKPDNADRLRHAFRLCLAREPSALEQKRLSELLAQQVAESEASGEDAKQLAAWTTIARVLLNLDEFITRE